MSAPAPLLQATLAQVGTELRLTARRGENVLVTIIIPVVVLLFFASVSVLPTGDGAPVDFLLPGALALAVGVAAGFGLPGIVATLVGLPAWALYAAMVSTVRAGAGLPLASLELAAPWDKVAAAAAAIVIGKSATANLWTGWFTSIASRKW